MVIPDVPQTFRVSADQKKKVPSEGGRTTEGDHRRPPTPLFPLRTA